MANISFTLNKKGQKEMYNGNYAKAVEIFFRCVMLEADNKQYILDLIYALNQNADYSTALEYCYALIGQNHNENVDYASLYFLCGEAFGGIGSAFCCAQMLKRSLKTDPNGKSSREATDFLKELVEKYELKNIPSNTDEASFGLSTTMSDIPYPNYETAVCFAEVEKHVNEGRFKEAIACIEQELDKGNYSITLLCTGIIIAAQCFDREYMETCAERFKFVEDYTVHELKLLAINMSALNYKDIAYTVYRNLYSIESGEKDIIFGYAVACERNGNYSFAHELIQELLAFEGGVGPAASYIKQIGTNSHSFLYCYEGEAFEEKLAQIDNIGAEIYAEPRQIIELFDFIKYISPQKAKSAIEKFDVSDSLTALEMRRTAISQKANIFTRAFAAKKLLSLSKTVYFNTGTDIIKFNDAVFETINKLYEKEIYNETTD